MSSLMPLYQFLHGLLSPNIKTRYRIFNDTKKLNSIQKIDCELNNLCSKSDLIIEDVFQSAALESRWNDSKKQFDTFKIPDGSGGINHGDRRAIYYLISKLKPSAVLEVGTHIGASTIHIAAALNMSRVKEGIIANLTTVDILDVNSDVKKPWLKYGTKYSPAEMINQLNCETFVKFVTDNSLNYATNCQEKFDFIFLDGSHAADIVYREIPLALKLLNKNGVILLHDYFPSMKPLWSDGSVISGPYLAIERFIKEGASLAVLELGKLPWSTKLDSNVTSLALLLKND